VTLKRRRRMAYSLLLHQVPTGSEEHYTKASNSLCAPLVLCSAFNLTMPQKFYYRGVKLIFIRRKEVTIIKARIKAGGSPITRSEYRFVIAQKDDVRK
jgi:hypothetical protein